MIVKLRRKNPRYRDLTPGQPYVVIGIEADDLRILNDAGRPYLYSPNIFQVLDPHEPADWVSELGEESERYAYPTPLNKPGFFEDFFDGKPKAVGTFWRVVNQRLAAVTAAAQHSGASLKDLAHRSLPAQTCASVGGFRYRVMRNSSMPPHPLSSRRLNNGPPRQACSGRQSSPPRTGVRHIPQPRR